MRFSRFAYPGKPKKGFKQVWIGMGRSEKRPEPCQVLFLPVNLAAVKLNVKPAVVERWLEEGTHFSRKEVIQRSHRKLIEEEAVFRVFCERLTPLERTSIRNHVDDPSRPVFLLKKHQRHLKPDAFDRDR